MLKVLIADDERIQREGILKHISWQNFDMQVVACAKDGVEALELSRIHKPDILITDIKMPYKNGLELSQSVKEFLPKIKILIISGYEEFEYARSAIELNASAFILKPIKMEEMREQLTKIRDVCAMEQHSEKEISELRKQMEENRPVLIKQFVEDLLSGAIKDEVLIRNKSEFLKITLPSSSYHVFFVELDDHEAMGENEEDRQLFYLGIENYIHELCKEYINKTIYRRRDGEYVIVLNTSNHSTGSIYEVIESIRTAVETKTGQPVTIGVSNTKSSVSKLNEGFKEAEKAVGQKFYMGSGRSILFSDIGLKQNSVLGMEDRMNELVQFISIGNSIKANEVIDCIFSELAVSSVEEKYVKTLCFSIISCIHRILYEMDEKMENIFGEEDILWNKIYKVGTIPDVRQWLRNIISTVTSHLYRMKKEKSTSIVDSIKKILEEKYCEQITIDDLAKSVYLTPNYICNLFKDKTGESIIDYLTRVRMKKAQQFLENDNMKIYEIAEKTGYNSTSYFSIVFKNNCGVSPKEYRDKLMEGRQ